MEEHSGLESVKGLYVKNRVVIAALLWMMFGIVYLFGAMKQGLFLKGVPGPGFLPFLCGAALAICAAIVIAIDMVKRFSQTQQDRTSPEAFDRAALVRVIVGVPVARRAGKRQEDQPEHVEGRAARGKNPERRQQPVLRMPQCHLDGRRDDRVLGEVPRERRQARQRQRRDDEGDAGQLHLLPQPAHLAHVLRVDGVDHAARAEEEAGLEERVRRQVVDAAGVPR